MRERADLVSSLDRDVGRVLAESRDVREATPRLLETVARELGWDAATLWEVEGREAGLARVHAWQAPGTPSPPLGDGPGFDGGVGLPGRVLASGEPAWVADVREDPAFGRPGGDAAAGIRAAAAFPITGTRGVRGVIELFSRRPRPPDPSLMQAMTSVGRYVGQHMERRRAEEAVRRGEAVRGAVLESAIDSVITMNHEGRVVEFNPAAERTFGYRRSDAVGKLVRELIVPADQREAHQRGLERYLATGEGPLVGTRAEVMAMKADGTEFPVEISITRIGHDDPPMFAAYLRDVTARKAAEETVRRLAAIVEHSNDAIVAADLRGTIVAWNPAAEGLYGWTAAEIIGRHISVTAPPDRQSETNFLARQVADGNSVVGHRTVRMRKDGSLVDVSLTLSPILGSNESVVGLAGDHQRHHGGEAHRGRAHPAAGPGKGGTAARGGARAACVVHRGGAGSTGQLAELRRGPEAAHPAGRPGARGLVRGAHAGARRLDHPGGRRPRGSRRRCNWPRSLSRRYPPDPDDPAGSAGRAAHRRATARARDHRRAPGGRRPRRGAPRDHPRTGPVLGDDRPPAGAQPDARRDHPRVRGVRAPVRGGGPRVRVRARTPGRAVGRQRAPAQRADQPQPGARVPGRCERTAGRHGGPRRDTPEAG